MLGSFAHLGLSQLTLSLHVLEARRLDTQLSLHAVQVLLRSCQLLPAGGKAATQAFQLIGLVCDLPLQAVMLAASSVKQALELPHIVLTGSTGVLHRSKHIATCVQAQRESSCSAAPFAPCCKLARHWRWKQHLVLQVLHGFGEQVVADVFGSRKVV